MGKIQVLDDHLSNMIAAGEVVERPASVVKELVENAVDAKAKRIEIHIEEGGLQLIRIVDDGHGMDRADCEKAFERHATSKIKTTRDLFHIRTLGFRGEALPSIASVSRVELVSSESSREVGCKIQVEAGNIVSIADHASVQGTDISVRDLFYNTPARLKYMKSISTEVGHVSDYVNRLALTYPEISFTFSHNGKTLLKTSGDGKLLHVVAAIYGVQVAKLLVPVEGETLDFKWQGFISKTEVTRANRSYISTLINGRYVRNYALTNAIMRGYHTFLPVGRYPIVVLHLEMDPTLLDVNVHPAKLEVRISKEQELCEAVEQSVQSALRAGLKIIQPLQAEKKPKITYQQPIQPQFDLRGPAADQRLQTGISAPARIRESVPNMEVAKPVVQAPAIDQRLVRETKPVLSEQEPVQDHARPPMVTTEIRPAGQRDTPETDGHGESKALMEPQQPKKLQEPKGREEPAHVDSSLDESVAPVPVLYPVGQVHGTYIIAQNDQGMYLIDQHAAQERIYYELFMRKLAEESTASQILLFPHTIECTTAEEAKLQKRLGFLQSLGLEMEPFGNRAFIVRAHPHWFPQGCEIEVIEELVQFVLEANAESQIDIVKMREKAAIMMSCKASIKANRFLTQAEMEQLLEDLRATTSPFTCPHGRPIMIHFSTYDLEKMFKRVM